MTPVTACRRSRNVRTDPNTNAQRAPPRTGSSSTSSSSLRWPVRESSQSPSRPISPRPPRPAPARRSRGLLLRDGQREALVAHADVPAGHDDLQLVHVARRGPRHATPLAVEDRTVTRTIELALLGVPVDPAAEVRTD